MVSRVDGARLTRLRPGAERLVGIAPLPVKKSLSQIPTPVLTGSGSRVLLLQSQPAFASTPSRRVIRCHTMTARTSLQPPDSAASSLLHR